MGGIVDKQERTGKTGIAYSGGLYYCFFYL